ncbi:MAG: hypothetical protein C0411_26440 [Pseudomonas sp.]|nr:hypothetical protein [Pseudomonas sp.]
MRGLTKIDLWAGYKCARRSNVKPPAGASLLAIAVVQSTSMLNVMALSRAGSLLQGTVFNFRWVVRPARFPHSTP